MNFGLTGYTGFIGSALKEALKPSPVILLGRTCPESIGLTETFQEFDLLEPEKLSELDLHKLDCVIHCAGIAQQPSTLERDSEKLYMKTNFESTVALAKRAAEHGVKRFVFISTVKIFGERMNGDEPFNEASPANPEGPYAISKLYAENALLELTQDLGMDVVIVRLPLVYGRGVKGNFAKLGRVAAKGWPLPLANATKLRSMVGVHNTVDFIIAASYHENARGKVLLVTDECDYSTSFLVKKLAEGQGKRARLIKVPMHLVDGLCRLSGQRATYDRLFGAYKINAESSKACLGWQPKYSIEDEISFMYKNEY